MHERCGNCAHFDGPHAGYLGYCKASPDWDAGGKPWVSKYGRCDKWEKAE